MAGQKSIERSARTAPGRVLLVAAFGAFLAFLDATVVNVAFPDIRESFPEASVGDLSWVLNAYNIVFAAFLVVFGRITDLLGRRRMFSLGTLVFTMASVLCALAPSLELLVAARVLQALGAALLVPASLAVVIEAFPTERRSHAVGLWGASAAVAAGLGPPVGGALVEIGGWRLAFLINLPIGIAAIMTIRGNLVESRAPGRRKLPDLRGALLLAAGLSALTTAIIQGPEWGWASPGVLLCEVLALALIGGFAASSLNHPQPMLDPGLLVLRPFTMGNLATIVAGMGFYAYMLTNILWLQYVWGYNILQAGAALVPGAVVAAIVAGALGEVAQKHGYRRIIVPGALVWCAAYVWYAQVVGPDPAFLTEWLPGQILSGIGVGATLPLLASAALTSVPGGRYATASAVLSSARQLGGVLGISILVVIIGTPTAANAEAVLRDGWVFCAACFALVAVGGLLLGRIKEHDTVAEPAGRSGQMLIPEQRGTDNAELLTPDQRPDSCLSRLPAEVRAEFEAAGTTRVLQGGEWLFREGDAAHSMYLVTSGRLEVVVGGRVVRELGAGAVLGELALLTDGQPRSASVRARRDSEL
ncbi:MAG TPA: DHA2 family efflux MFS transporter permease subunit, partial [Nocardioidaceae bacterium]|nr:DHA2 family efflux MFS transporter permease subunit [Nocardioidaceae bacterium]